MARVERALHGGILGLAGLICDHGAALEYDLMCRAHYTLDDLGFDLSVRALASFVSHLPPDSALARETADDGGELGRWSDVRATPMLLAALVDEVRYVSWEVAQANSRHDLRSRMPRPIPRPGVADGGRQTVGSDPVPASEFESWYYGGDEHAQH